MNFRQPVIVATLGLLLLPACGASAFAQASKRPSTRRAVPAKTTTTATTAPARSTAATTASQANASAQAGATLAVVNNQNLTLVDLDPKVQEAFNDLDRQLAEARTNALNALIDEYLIQEELKKRKVTLEQLTATEISDRVIGPTDAEIKAVYDANREQLGASDMASVRPQIVAYLRQQQSTQLYNALTARLRAATPPTLKGEPNAANLAPASIIATVGAHTISAAAVEELAKPIMYEARAKVYEVEHTALERKINDLLLAAEAKRINTTPELVIKTEVTDKIKPATDAEVAKFYEDNKGNINADFASVRSQISDFLNEQQQLQLENAYADKLRAGGNVRVLLTEPEMPALNVSTDDDPARGDIHAPVTMVVFTDFQCPACKTMHPLIDDLIKSYGNRIRLVVRDYPLPQHEFARKAAEAANAANAQGKFFEYMAVLFAHQPALDVPSLKKYASEVGLDRAKFDAALDSGQYAPEVTHDVLDGDHYGVSGTPAIFVNGVRVKLQTLTIDPVRAAVEKALKK